MERGEDREVKDGELGVLELHVRDRFRGVTCSIQNLA
jgi:hypothetical protein